MFSKWPSCKSLIYHLIYFTDCCPWQAKQTAERLREYAAKKSKKPGPIAKSNIIFDVKPWDDTIDIAEIEKNVSYYLIRTELVQN